MTAPRTLPDSIPLVEGDDLTVSLETREPGEERTEGSRDLGQWVTGLDFASSPDRDVTATVLITQYQGKKLVRSRCTTPDKAEAVFAGLRKILRKSRHRARRRAAIKRRGWA